MNKTNYQSLLKNSGTFEKSEKREENVISKAKHNAIDLEAVFLCVYVSVFYSRILFAAKFIKMIIILTNFSVSNFDSIYRYFVNELTANVIEVNESSRKICRLGAKSIML